MTWSVVSAYTPTHGLTYPPAIMEYTAYGYDMLFGIAQCIVGSKKSTGSSTNLVSDLLVQNGNNAISGYDSGVEFQGKKLFITMEGLCELTSENTWDYVLDLRVDKTVHDGQCTDYINSMAKTSDDSTLILMMNSSNTILYTHDCINFSSVYMGDYASGLLQASKGYKNRIVRITY